MSEGERYLIDTHVAIAFGAASGLQGIPSLVRRIIDDPATELLLSVASQIEIAINNRLGKLHVTKTELDAIYTNAIVTSYPIRREHADTLFDLPLHHKDPFDRIIIATALTDDIPVISSDRQFRKYKGLRLVW